MDLNQGNEKQKDIKGYIVENTDIFDNIGQTIFMITRDKFKLLLIEHIDAIIKRKTFLLPLGLFLAIALTFCTADFKNFLFLKKAHWESIFALAGAVCLFFTVQGFIRSRGEKSKIDFLIKEIKKESSKTKEEVGVDSVDSKEYFKIIKAIYGSEEEGYEIDDGNIDILKIVQEIAKDEGDEITSSNKLAKDSGKEDPANGVIKYLRIKYSIRGQEKNVVIKEGEKQKLD